MSIRSALLTVAIGLAGVGSVAADGPRTIGPCDGGGFACTNGVGVGCVGMIAGLPITVNVCNVRVLNGNELSILADNLNYLSVLECLNLDYNGIIKDVETEVVSDFVNDFDINVTRNNVDVCTIIGGIQLCK